MFGREDTPQHYLCKNLVEVSLCVFRIGLRLFHLLMSLKRHRANHTTAADLFTRNVARHPDKTAIIFEDETWSFKALDEFANRVGNHFRAAGLQKGDTVALFMENCPEYLGAMLGLCKIGVVTAFVNYHLRQEALAHSIRISKCSTIIFSSSLTDALGAVLPDLDVELRYNCYSLCGESALPHAKSLEEKLKSCSPHPPPPPPNKSFEGRSPV